MKQIDPSEIKIITYLTGEMSAQEAGLFEKEIGQNQLLSAQVEEMRLVQQTLGNWRNSDIDIPDFGASRRTDFDMEPRQSSLRTMKMPQWLKYAAAVVGFACLMHLVGFEVNKNGNTLMLSFGSPDAEMVKPSDIDAVVAKALDNYASKQNSHLAAFEEHMNSELSAISQKVDHMSNKNSVDLSALEGLFNQNMDGQYVRLESMIRSIEDNQRQEIEDSFTGFVEYIDNKRARDQFKIQNAFNEIATAINNQQNQTNALLTSISVEDTGLKSY